MMEPATAANQWVNTLDSRNPEVIEKARSILQENFYCTLSTASASGDPWSSPVYFAYDDRWHLYWASTIVARHSQNLETNGGRVSVSLFSVNPDSSVKGLYLYGVAGALEDPTAIEPAMVLLVNRREPVERTVEDYWGESPRRIYHFTPQQAWVYGPRLDIGHPQRPVDTKIQVDLGMLS